MEYLIVAFLTILVMPYIAGRYLKLGKLDGPELFFMCVLAIMFALLWPIFWFGLVFAIFGQKLYNYGLKHNKGYND